MAQATTFKDLEMPGYVICHKSSLCSDCSLKLLKENLEFSIMTGVTHLKEELTSKGLLFSVFSSYLATWNSFSHLLFGVRKSKDTVNSDICLLSCVLHATVFMD